MAKIKKKFQTILWIQGLLLVLFSFDAQAESFDWVSRLTSISANMEPSIYSITSISGSSQVIETEPDLGFPTAKLYTFKLCLAHAQSNEPLLNATIGLEGAGSPIKPQRLDSSCLTWMESINYHYTAPSRFVSLIRTLQIQTQDEKKNVQSISIPFRLAINPWLHGEPSSIPEVADFIKNKPRNSVPPAEATKALLGQTSKGGDVSVIVNDSRINFQELGIDSKSGGKFIFDFRTNPQIEVLNTANQPVFIKLNQGEFHFEAYLLSTLSEGENQVRRIINPEPIKGTALLRDGALAFQTEITLPFIPTRGRLELAVILKANQNQPFLKPFKGIYILGNYNDLKTNLFARIKTGYTNANSKFQFEDYLGLNKQSDKTYAAKNSQDGMRQLKYEFEPLQFKITRVGNETATRREVYYQVKACVRNGVDNSPLRGYHFQIIKGGTSLRSELDLKPTMRPSEFDSCIYWDDRIDHNYYSNQKYFKQEYRILNRDLNLDETVVAYINPWEMILSRDARTIEPEEIARENTESKGSAIIALTSFQAQTRTIHYAVDRTMSLKINKDVHLILEPKIMNYSSLSKGIDGREPIRDGIWKIRWALLHNRYESEGTSFRPISQGETLTIASNGRIILPVTFRFDDFRTISSRNYLMIEVAPVDATMVTTTLDGNLVPKDGKPLAMVVDSQGGFLPQTFIGPILTVGDSDTSYLIPHPENPALKLFLPQGVNGHQISQNEVFLFEKQAPTWTTLSEMNNPAAEVSESQLVQWRNTALTANQIRTFNLYDANDIRTLRKKMGPSAFTLQNFSKNYGRELFQPEIVIRSIEAKILSAELEDRLCFYFFDLDAKQTVRFNNNIAPWIQTDRWLKKCLQSVTSRSNAMSFFRAEHETTVESIDRTSLRESSALNLGIGTSFSVSSSESTSTSSSLGASTNIGLSLKASDMVSMGASTSYSISRSESQNQGSSNSLSLSAGVNLSMRKISLLIEGTTSERCLTIQLNPALYEDKKSDFWHDLVKSTKSIERAGQFVNEKVRLCYSLAGPQKFSSIEKYYFLLQDNPNVGFIDNPDLRNRPLILQLRGQTAYENFLRIAGADLALSKQAGSANLGNFSTDERTTRALQLKIPGSPGSITEIMSRQSK